MPCCTSIRIIVAFFILFCSGNVLYGQNQALDSLQKQYQLAIEPVKKNDLGLTIAGRLLQLNNLDEAARYGGACWTYCAQLKQPGAWAKYYRIQAMIAQKKNNYDSTIFYARKSLKYAEEDHSRDNFLDLKRSCFLVGDGYLQFGRMADGFAYLIKADSLPGDRETRSIDMRINTSLVRAYASYKKFDKALYHADKALQWAYEVRDKGQVAAILSNIGTINLDLGNPKVAMKYYDSAYRMDNNHTAAAKTIHYLYTKSNCYYNMNLPDSTILYAQQTLALGQTIADTPKMRAACELIYVAYEQLKKKDSCFKYININRAYVRNSKDLLMLADINKTIAECYASFGNYDSAYHFMNEYLANKDSITLLENTNNIHDLEVRYETTQKEKQIAEQTLAIQAKQLQNLQLQKSIQLNALKAEYDKKQVLARTEKERQQLRYEEGLKRQQIENDYAAKQAALIAEQQRQQLIASNEKRQKDEQLKISHLQLRQQWFYGIAALMTLLGAGIGYYLYSRNRRQKLQNQLEREHAAQLLKDATYKARLNDISFAALRSQMNPHFIFNCLNSIKLYTEQNNSEAASQYLDKFASLIRNTLDNARMEKVVLQDEIKSLELYLQMETMRFKQKLSYTIAVDENVDTEFIEVPPMLVQPYVENAIWHGLMHKKGGGEINIHFAQVQANSLLLITIHDNGIGRALAAELKSKTAEKHKSYGTKITGERITLINEKYGADADIDIQDLKDAAGQATGTLVTIKLPIK